ncbi:hypothetical protein SESBI_48693 [Sesbania bispinosa]|nr:hypothetical protein SESBI_48693 [Sesbania bispinosa]
MASSREERTKVDKKDHGESKAALSKPDLSNAKEVGKGKQNSTAELSMNNTAK